MKKRLYRIGLNYIYPSTGTFSPEPGAFISGSDAGVSTGGGVGLFGFLLAVFPGVADFLGAAFLEAAFFAAFFGAAFFAAFLGAAFLAAFLGAAFLAAFFPAFFGAAFFAAFLGAAFLGAAFFGAVFFAAFLGAAFLAAFFRGAAFLLDFFDAAIQLNLGGLIVLNDLVKNSMSNYNE